MTQINIFFSQLTMDKVQKLFSIFNKIRSGLVHTDIQTKILIDTGADYDVIDAGFYQKLKDIPIYCYLVWRIKISWKKDTNMRFSHENLKILINRILNGNYINKMFLKRIWGYSEDNIFDFNDIFIVIYILVWCYKNLHYQHS